MRILYLTNGFPYPLTSGYLRHYFLIKELSPRHAITLLSVVGADYQSDHAAAVSPFTERIVTFTAANKSGRSGARPRTDPVYDQWRQGHRAVQQMGTLRRLAQREHSRW
jgi:hypothetical protein